MDRTRYSRFMVSDKRADDRSRLGLCADCLYSKPIESARASKFYLCGLSTIDPAFPKYPRLPVVQCSGFKGTAAQAQAARLSYAKTEKT